MTDPEKEKRRRALAAMALAAMGAVGLPGGFGLPRPKGKCTHSFGLAGGFSECSACEIKVRSKRR